MTNTELPELSSFKVDDALAEASSSSKQSDSMKTFSVRLPEDVKEMAQEVCERHATDLGTFLRECAKGLIRDYYHAEPDSAAVEF
jgi:hypothetical protein